MYSTGDIDKALKEGNRLVAQGHPCLKEGGFFRRILAIALAEEAAKIVAVPEEDIKAAIAMLAESCTIKQHRAFMLLTIGCLRAGVWEADPLAHHFGSVFWGKDLTPHESSSS